MNQHIQLHKKPYLEIHITTNNRKRNKARLTAKDTVRIQSIPIYRDIRDGELVGQTKAKEDTDFYKFAGFRYVEHQNTMK
jgi:hypothetical protein